MATKRKPLIQQQYNQLAQSTSWKIVELDPSRLKAIPGIQRKESILGAFVSSDPNSTKILNEKAAVLGMDVICYEDDPQTDRGEGPVNVYHYIITKTGDERLPYCLYGKFIEETLMGHWPSDLDLSVYGLK